MVGDFSDNADDDGSTGVNLYIDYVVDGVRCGLGFDVVFDFDCGVVVELPLVLDVRADVGGAVVVVETVRSNG